MTFNSQYNTLLSKVRDIGQYNRDKISLVQQTLVHSYAVNGFPLLRIKPTPMRSAIKELLWFISESYDYNDLRQSGVTWWDPWFVGRDSQVTDTTLPYKKHRKGFQRIAKLLMEKHFDTRLYVNLWPEEQHLSQAILPPCTLSYQVIVSNGLLNLTVYQRSADLLCGVPANVAQYQFLLLLYAELAELKPGNLMFVYGDLHVYREHYDNPNWDELLRTTRRHKSMQLDSVVRLGGVEKISNRVRSGLPLDAECCGDLYLRDTYEHCGRLEFPVVPVHTN